MFSYSRNSSKQLCLLVMVTFLVLPMTAYGPNFATMMNALKSNAGPIIRFVIATAYVIGLWFIISSIMELKKMGESLHSQSQSSSFSGPIVKFIVGVLLIYLPTTIDVSVWTIWGHTAMGEEGVRYMQYAPSGADPFGSIKGGAIAIVRVVGYVSFVRGLIMLSHTSQQGSQPGTFGKGFMHIVGGILAINVVETINIIKNTLGF